MARFVARCATFVARGAGLVANCFRNRAWERPIAPMKTPTLNSIVIFFTLLTILSNVGATSVDDAPRSIAAQLKTLMTALAEDDPSAAAQVFTTDARLSVPGANGVVAGRTDIAEFWRSALAGGLESVEWSTTDLEGEGDLRIESGSYIAFGANRAEVGRGYYLLAWKKEGGAWKIHRDFARPIAAPVTGAQGAQEHDRVGFPRSYAAQFHALGGTQSDPNSELTTVFANELAASAARSEGGRFPDGAVIVMEFARPQKDGEDQLLRDAHGQPLKGEIAHVDVMRRGAGFGAAYGASRAGEWEFASYRPDGSTLIPPARAQHCAACHQKAGADKDFVFRRRSWSAAH
jgi:ketosteroid isomerase-like protein/mono/diheme cytochrome c family protein